MLASFPDLAGNLDVERVEWPRPRHPVIAAVGEANQSLPLLVLANGETSERQSGIFFGQAFINDKDQMTMGSIQFIFHHAPGHTSDSMLIETNGHVMTGDFLFTGKGGVGRDDLPSGRMKVHWDALSVLERLDGHLIVCTGHDPPGTEMMSLKWNRENNPVLNMNSYDEYEAWQLEVSAGLGAVSKIKTAVPANVFAEIPEHIPWLDGEN